MKKLNILYLFLILFCLSFAQESQKFNQKLQYSRMGLYVAPAINVIQTNSDEAETGSNSGIVYGYALEMSLNKNHYIETGFSISYKGGDIKINNSTTDYKVEYLSFPVFIKMRSREIGYFNYFARIGPSLNFRIKDMISSNDKAKLIALDISIFLGTEYSLGGKTSIEGSLFFNNNISNSIANNNMHALFHQFGLRIGFLF